MVSIAEALSAAALRLCGAQSTDTPRLDAEVLLAHALSKDRVYLLINKNENVPEDIRERFSAYIQRRLDGEPVSYITGVKEFMSVNFSVCPGVLIPRPDTEVLAEAVIEAAEELPAPRILDLCTGSGALAVSIAKYVKKAYVTAVDFSPLCIGYTQINAASADVSERVNIICADIFDDVCYGEKFDIIVSNPPYIKSGDLPALDKTVRNFEPATALDGGDDGLVFYRRIADIAPGCLKDGGILALEVGFDQADSVSEILKGSGFTGISCKHDLSGIRRAVFANKPGK